jgi:hypothetical protein
MWQQIKNLFSKSQESIKVSSEETIQQISQSKQEPTIKKLKRQISYRKDPKFRENCSSSE